MPEQRNPIRLTADSLAHKPSPDKLQVKYDPVWSEMRSGRAGRDIKCYAVRNLTKETIYDVEIFLDDEGEPWGWCGCPATVVCKHIRVAAKEMALIGNNPEFGKEEQTSDGK